MNEIMDDNETRAPGFQSERRGWMDRIAGRKLNLFEKGVGILVILFFLFLFYIALDANKYPAMVHVIEGEGVVGVNPTDEALDFGDLSLGTSAVRRVDVQNGTGIPMYVAVFTVGEIGELMDIKEKRFRLAGGEGAKVEFTTYIPASAPVGETYTGRVYLFKIPTFGL